LADDDRKLLIERDRGQKAEALLENPLLREAFDAMEATYIEAWKSNGATLTGDSAIPHRLDAAGRDRLWQMVQVVGKVRSHIEAMVNDGKVAGAILAQSAQADT